MQIPGNQYPIFLSEYFLWADVPGETALPEYTVLLHTCCPAIQDIGYCAALFDPLSKAFPKKTCEIWTVFPN